MSAPLGSLAAGGGHVEPAPDVATEASLLRRNYLVAVTYPLWHLLVPEGARDPWILWWLVASSYALVAGLSLVNGWVAARLRHLFPLCSWLVTLHLYVLAHWNDMSPFYAVGSVMAVVTTFVFIRNRDGLLAYMIFLGVTTATLYQLEPSTTKLAYWGGILTVLPLAYVRLDVQLRREAMARDMAAELEARVEERTREVRQANTRLQTEMAERKRLEGQLRFSHKMEVLGRIAGELAHDFNNLLTTVNIYAELVLDGLEPESSVRRDAEQIRKTTRQASALTQQLLAFNRGPGEARRIDVNDAVLEVASMVRRILPEEIQLDLRLAERPAPVRADPDQLVRVLMNLIFNARDAMPEGGELRLEVADGPARAPGHVLLSVRDTGHGMDEETLGHAFDPFFTRKPQGEGTGLGLSIVYGIVAQGGGSVRAESEPGVGTRFEILWPRDESADAIEAEEPAPAPGGTGRERILLVEDEAELRAVLARVLGERGYEVAEAADGEEALGRIAADAAGFDLVVSDVVMPGMDGYALAARLGREHPGMRLLLMSAQPSHPSLGKRQAPPGIEILAKPFALAELTRRVATLLEEDAGAPS